MSNLSFKDVAVDKTLFLVGPTASGKTGVAIELAAILPVEIISLDSMNVYRGMDIGTAKPTRRQREAVAHRLIDIVDPSDSYSVGRYAEEAARAVGEIRGRGRLPLFVGGTPLYLKVMTSGLFSGPSADGDFRRTLHERAEAEGTEVLHEELRELDPAAAKRIHPNDLKRIVRALEVFRRTGQPISKLQTEWSVPRSDRGSLIAGIARDRQELYRRIEDRVDDMFARGLVDEVRGLLKKFGTLSREASQALGYGEVLAYLRGETDLERTVELVKRNTRRMAKRQLTWFRSFGNICWFNMGRDSTAEAAARQVANYFGESATRLPGRARKRDAGPG